MNNLKYIFEPKSVAVIGASNKKGSIGYFKTISEKIKNGDSAIGTLISDTTCAHNLNRSMDNIKNSSEILMRIWKP